MGGGGGGGGGEGEGGVDDIHDPVKQPTVQTLSQTVSGRDGLKGGRECSNVIDINGMWQQHVVKGSL